MEVSLQSIRQIGWHRVMIVVTHRLAFLEFQEIVPSELDRVLIAVGILPRCDQLRNNTVSHGVTAHETPCPVQSSQAIEPRRATQALEVGVE